MQVTSQMWNWSLDRRIVLFAEHLPGFPECGCRSGITKEMGQLRMEVTSDDFSTNHANSGPLSGESFCLQNIGSTSKIRELETRYRSSSDRRFESVLDEHERLCLSSFCIDRQVPIQDSERESQRVNTHGTSMANSAMVCSSPVNVVSETTPPAETAISPDESQQESPTDTSIKSSCVANIRNSLSHQGISSQATTLILYSWRKITEDAYSCCWRRWEQWCASSGYNSIQAPIRPCQFNSLFNRPDRPYILLIPKKLRKRSQCNHNVDSHVISSVEH